MWGELAWATFVAALVLYVPGYAFLRGLRLSRTLALCAAPLYGAAAYAFLPVVYYELGISCGPVTVFVPAFALAAIVFAWARLTNAGRAGKESPCQISPQNAGTALLFVGIATIVCLAVFVHALPQAGAFAPRHDNITHLNLLRAFLDSGSWSSLHTNTFLASAEQAQSISGDGGFYPAGWSCMVVLTTSIAGTDLMVSANALVVLTSSLVFPLGMFAFMRALLPNERRTLLLGAIASAGFANWPWQYIHTGPLYPNQYGIALQFCALAIVLTCATRPLERSKVPTYVSLAAVSFVALALAHPSTLFYCYVFLVFAAAHRLWHADEPRGRRIVRLCVLVGAATAVWALCYALPPLQSTINYVENERSELAEVLVDLLTMQYCFVGPQIGMAVVSWVGIVRVWRSARLRWLLLPVAFFALGYVAVRADWWFVKHWIAALWYSDLRRMAANLTLSLMPIAALGLDALLPSAKSARAAGIRTVTFACVLLATFMPAVTIPFTDLELLSPFAQVAQLMTERYQEPIYSPEEVAFADRVLQAIPADSLVINSPADGSMWAYGINGLNTYYRDFRDRGHTDDARLLREHLAEYANRPDVQAAVERTGAAYVLLLDKDVAYEDGSWLWQYTQDQEPLWKGITSIDDSTPGFSTVLADRDDLRLYRIDRPSNNEPPLDME